MLPGRMVRIVPHPLAFQDSGQLWEWASCSGFRGDISGDGPLAWSDRGRPNRTHTVCSNPGWSCQLRYAPTACLPTACRGPGSHANASVRFGRGLRPLSNGKRHESAKIRRSRGGAPLDLDLGRGLGIVAGQGMGRIVCERGILARSECSVSYPLLPSGPPCRARLDLVPCCILIHIHARVITARPTGTIATRGRRSLSAEFLALLPPPFAWHWLR